MVARSAAAVLLVALLVSAAILLIALLLATILLVALLLPVAPVVASLRDDVSAFLAPCAWHDILVRFRLTASHGVLLMRIPLMVRPGFVACLAFVPAR